METLALETITAAEYLRLERTTTREEYGKFEFINNELFEMAGASLEHNRIFTNLLVFLANQLEYFDYQVLGSDQRIVNLLRDSYCYPDISVTKGEMSFLDNEFDTITNPVLLVEIESQSSVYKDNFLKLEVYKSIPSVKEYLIVAQDKIHVRHYKKIAENHWEFFDINSKEESIEVLANQFKIPVTAIYKKTGLV
ncbi:MAG: Uma2 family endonuclease [Cytophagales bacterium]